jgi:hypothetical protein
VHRVLRWVTLGLIVGQIVLGAIAGNLDRQSRELGIAHLVVGTTTWATLTAQGILGSLLAF